MPQPIIAPDMLGAIARSKSVLNDDKVYRCKKCDSTNIYEIEESEGKMIVTYKVCENCNHKEIIKETKRSLIGNLLKKK